MHKEKWDYDAEVIKVIDGDSLWLKIDLGMRVNVTINCHLNGFNAPDIQSMDPEERLKGHTAKNHLSSLLMSGSKVYVVSHLFTRHGPVVDIYAGNVFVNQEMIDSELVTTYNN